MCWSWLLPPSHHTFHHMQIDQITLITANMHPTKQPISATISSINPSHSTAAAVHLDSLNVSFPHRRHRDIWRPTSMLFISWR